MRAHPAPPDRAPAPQPGRPGPQRAGRTRGQPGPTWPAFWIGSLGVVSLFGVLQRPPLFPVNLTYLSYAFLALVFAVRLVGGQLARPRFAVGDLLVLGLFVSLLGASASAYLFSGWPLRLNEASAATFLGMLVLYFVTRLSLRRPRDAQALVTFLLVGLFVQLTLSLTQYFVQGSSGAAPLLDEEFAFVDATSFDEGLRLAGPLGNANMFASVPLLLFPVAVALAAVERRRLQQVAFGGMAALATAGILVAFSRSAWAGWAVSLVALGYGLWLGRRRVRRAGWLVTGAVTALAALALISALQVSEEAVGARFSSVAEEEAFGARASFWAHGLDMLASHPLGVGMGNYRTVSEAFVSPFAEARGRSPHASVLGLSVEGGLAAGLCFALLMLLQATGRIGGGVGRRSARAAPGRAPPAAPAAPLPLVRLRALLVGLQAGFLGLWVHAGFHSVHHHVVIWMLAACQVSLLQWEREQPSHAAA